MVPRVQQHHRHHRQQPACSATLVVFVALVLSLSMAEARSSRQHHVPEQQSLDTPERHYRHRSRSQGVDTLDRQQMVDLERLLLLAADREQLERHYAKQQQHQRRKGLVDLDYSLEEGDDNEDNGDGDQDEEDDDDQDESDGNFEDGAGLTESDKVEELPLVARSPRHRHSHQQRQLPGRRLRRGRHRATPLLDPLELAEQGPRDSADRLQFFSSRSHRARGKRYNAGVNGQRSKLWTDKDWKAFETSRQSSNPELYGRLYEIEVREAQNSSLCNYTVIPIPDPGGRIPSELEHIKCNHVGSRCQDTGTYCCLQTYRNVRVGYEDGKFDNVKVYSGCVCSQEFYGTLKPFNPSLPTND